MRGPRTTKRGRARVTADTHTNAHALRDGGRERAGTHEGAREPSEKLKEQGAQDWKSSVGRWDFRRLQADG